MKGIKLRWDNKAPIARNAALRLPKLASFYFETGRATFDHQATAAELHAFRLQTKRFRYTLELFRPVYGPGLERMIHSLRRVQQLLGEVNDCEESRKLVAATGRRFYIQARRVLRYLDSLQKAKISELRAFWEEFDQGGIERKWKRYFAAYVGRNEKRSARKPPRNA